MPQRSPYLKNGSPSHCAYLGCLRPFRNACFHCRDDNRYYCDRVCADHELKRVATAFAKRGGAAFHLERLAFSAAVRPNPGRSARPTVGALPMRLVSR